MPEQLQNDGGGSGDPVAAAAGSEGQPLVASEGDQVAEAVSKKFPFQKIFHDEIPNPVEMMGTNLKINSVTFLKWLITLF